MSLVGSDFLFDEVSVETSRIRPGMVPILQNVYM